MALTVETARGEPDELSLIQAARRDPRAFGDLYLRYVQRVFQYLYSRIGSAPEAEDATAQTFLAAFESFGRFRQDGHFASWLFSIARHKAMDHFRRRKTLPVPDEIPEPGPDGDPLGSAIQSEQAAHLSRLVRALSEEESELLRLRFLAGMSFPEIAHLLGRSEDAVKKSLYRLLARLHAKVEASHE